MEPIRYSVVIRTTGHAGEKYRRLLEAIAGLRPSPEEVIIVLPEGSNEPEERLGWERFCYCQKGMVRQRLYGLEQCRTPYALFCDDDVRFPPDFVKKLHQPIAEGIADLSAGPLLNFFPQKGVRTLASALTGGAMPMLPWRKMYVRVLRSSGYSYNRHIDTTQHLYYSTQSLPWTCFYASVQAMKDIHLEDETWLDAHGYAAMDDQTMFYKGYLRGIPTVVVSDALYEHMDAKTSTKVSSNRRTVSYSTGFNRVVFWHRFIWSIEDSKGKKAFDRICFAYHMATGKLYSKLNILRKKKLPEEDVVYWCGLSDGWSFVKSKEYQQLPNVVER